MSTPTSAVPTKTGIRPTGARSDATRDRTRRRALIHDDRGHPGVYCLLIDLLLVDHTTGGEIWGAVTAAGGSVVGLLSLGFMAARGRIPVVRFGLIALWLVIEFFGFGGYNSHRLPLPADAVTDQRPRPPLAPSSSASPGRSPCDPARKESDMLTLVVYDTKFGNTERIAEAIARGAGTLGSVHVMDIAEAAQPLAERPDLLLVGGPTQRRGPSPALRDFVEALPPSLQDVPAASFDTRYRGSTLLMGSAASAAANGLRKAGGGLVAPPESFFIARGGPLERQGLEPGELERAEGWGRAVAAAAHNGGSES
jgi:flavodoxin